MIDNKMMKMFPWKAVAVPSADLLHLKNDFAVHDFAKHKLT